jgi:hypothetical protein
MAPLGRSYSAAAAMKEAAHVSPKEIENSVLKPK